LVLIGEVRFCALLSLSNQQVGNWMRMSVVQDCEDEERYFAADTLASNTL
jgi:hypothetical protein